MDSVARQNQAISVNTNCGNVTDSYNNCNISVPDEKRRVLEWLSPLASRERHRAVRDSRADGVGDWLLRDQTFSTWRMSEDRAAKPILFCYGDPGVGKTYISSLVIDTLSKEIDVDGIAVTYVYCDFSARNIQSASTILGSVLRQVVGALAEIPEEVQKAFDRATKQVDSCGPRLEEILKMLMGSMSGLEKCFICIDALDEFPLKHQPDLWESLHSVVRECPSTRFFLTGRPHMQDQVRRYFPQSAEMLEISPKGYDIELYLRMRLRKDPELDAMDAGLRADILRLIPERVSGIFLLVCVNMDAILAEPTIHRRRQVLHRMTNGHGLQGAYNTTLDRIRQQGGSKSRLAMEALMWISHCERPLRSDELYHALGVEIGAQDFNAENVPSIRTVLGCVLGLVTIDKIESTVRLLHITLQEYLGGCPTLFVTAQSMMAETCLTYLNCPSIRSLPPGVYTARIRAPFLEYATYFWGTHAAREMAKPVKVLALRVLDRYENHVSADILWRGRICGWCLSSGPQGISGLHCIAYWGITDIAVEMLEMKRWDVNARDSRGDTPLIWAVKYGKDRVVELLLGQDGIKPDLVGNLGRTAFFLAAEEGNEKVVKLLLKRPDVNPNSPDILDWTPLLLAIFKQQEGIVELLLKRADVNPNLIDRNDRTAMSYAAASGNEDLVKLLLRRGDVCPDLSGRSGRTPLSFAASGGHKHVVELLLECRDVNPDSPDRNGRTPLSFAASDRHMSAVKLLLERGDVNHNLLAGYARTILLFASSSAHEGVVDLLLQRRDVNPNLSDHKGRTPLSFAARKGHHGTVKVLLESLDVNPNSSDYKGRTPLSLAFDRVQESIVHLFLERVDLNPDLPDNKGRTPLSHAAEWGSGHLVKQFLERADVNRDSLDRNGRTPLSFAAMRGRKDIVKLLLDRGAARPA